MKDSITDQLIKALDILKDYPGIEETLDIEVVLDFLKDLSESGITTIPNFKNVDPDQVKKYSNASRNSVKEWRDALSKIPGVRLVDPEDHNNPYNVISGYIRADLARLEQCGNDYDDTDFEFDFNSELDEEGNVEAWFRASHVSRGTWKEVYFMIIKHSNEHLRVPTLPAQ